MYGRFTSNQSSAVRKSRVENKPSMLPKPRRPGSTDRASVEARRPSNSYRSSSAEPARATLGVRLSREASATKIPLNRRSRSQQADKYGQSSVTPLRSSHYARTTTTPVRTPSEDRQSRSWQASLDRALAFVTVKDQRPISAMSWQRAEFARVLEALGARGGAGAGAGGQPALTRPLTITRFVDVCGDLLSAIMRDPRLNNDNYVTKLPNLAKRFLYPGVMSKSWLKTVNTLHAFPHALAFIAFLLDLVNHIETPVSDEWLYVKKDELTCLQRDFLYKSWIRFQDLEEYDDLDAEYLQNLKQLLGHDEGKVAQLQETIQQCQATLEDESELAARAEEERARSRREGLAGRVRALRAERRARRAEADAQLARREEQAALVRGLDADINNITAEIQQLKRELETQDITVAERALLLDEVDYATRVIDSKRTLAEQVSKIMLSKETELAVWQKRTLDACVEYKQALIHLAARFPPLAALAVDEQELMESRCAAAVSRAVDTLRAHAAALADRRQQHTRARARHCRERDLLLEETLANIAELKSVIARSQQAIEAESAREASDSAAWASERETLARAVEELAASEELYAQAHAELDFWEKQDVAWNSRLVEMHDYISSLKEQLRRELEAVKKQKANHILDAVSTWHMQLDRVEAEERAAELKAKKEDSERAV